MTTTLRIEPEEVLPADVRQLLQEHLADIARDLAGGERAALDVDALSAPGIAFWTMRDEEMLLGCGALKELSPRQGEIKSMRTALNVRRLPTIARTRTASS